MTLVERQIGEIWQKKEKEWQQIEIEKENAIIAQEIERRKIIRIGENLVKRAADVFKDIKPFRDAVVEAALPDFDTKRTKNSAINFSLKDTLIEVNFYPIKLFRNSIQFSLTMVNPDSTLEHLRIITYHASSESPMHRIRASRSGKDSKVEYNGATAAFKGLLMLKKVRELSKLC